VVPQRADREREELHGLLAQRGDDERVGDPLRHPNRPPRNHDSMRGRKKAIASAASAPSRNTAITMCHGSGS